jgi:probable blue pigment (indigoidine) exporter
MRSIVLGALNFSFFWAMLFVSAYRLPGGVAATVGAIQPLLVVALARLLIGTAIRPLTIVAGAVGMAGVGLLVLTPGAALNPIGIIAGLAGAVSMAFGTVLTRRWTPPVSNLTFTAWQLTAGGVLLLPVAVLLEPALPTPTLANVLGIVWLGLIGAAFTYLLWFRGLSKLEPAAVASLGFLSPLVATLLGWSVLGQNLTMMQIVGRWRGKRPRPSRPCPSGPNRCFPRHRKLGDRSRAVRLAGYADDPGGGQAHSPLRITGTFAPSGRTPSMSTSPEPIIQSMWIRLELPPCALICSWLSDAPSRKHFE